MVLQEVITNVSRWPGNCKGSGRMNRDVARELSLGQIAACPGRDANCCPATGENTRVEDTAGTVWMHWGTTDVRDYHNIGECLFSSH